MKYVFASVVVASIAYCYPHWLSARIQREIIRNNIKVTEAVSNLEKGYKVKSNGGGGLWGEYL